MVTPGQRVLVVGAGKSGIAVARFLVRKGARVTVTDRRPAAELGEARTALGDRVTWELGGHDASTFLGTELIVLSPGVPAIAPLESARSAGVPVTGEIELAARYLDAAVVAVTGTNGKSTVTAMAGEIARATGRPTFVGGNLGTPLTEAVDTAAARADGICVVELSSFQLETCVELRPRAAALLNLTPDHLDRYPDLPSYGAAKLRVAQRMNGGDVLVVNADDDFFMRATAHRGRNLRRRTFSARPSAPAGISAFVDGGELVHPASGLRLPATSLRTVGRHNMANALAALLLMVESGLAGPAEARAGLITFRPLPHRMELVRQRGGVRFYDDSKATNVDSVVAGLDGFPSRFVLIAGGRDKGGSYAPLVAALQQNGCIAAVLIGEAAPLIATAIGDALPVVRAATLDDAVKLAAERTRSGEAVVLSPACSSYDMFDNYQHRGRVFRAAVEALA